VEIKDSRTKFLIDSTKVNEAVESEPGRIWHDYQTGRRKTASRWGYGFGLNPDEISVVHLIVEQRIIDAGGELARGSTALHGRNTDQAKRRRHYEEHGFYGNYLSYTPTGLTELKVAWKLGRLDGLPPGVDRPD
jgi:hypothetical protein